MFNLAYSCEFHLLYASQMYGTLFSTTPLAFDHTAIRNMDAPDDLVEGEIKISDSGHSPDVGDTNELLDSFLWQH